jgi:hypothetical protein
VPQQLSRPLCRARTAARRARPPAARTVIKLINRGSQRALYLTVLHSRLNALLKGRIYQLSLDALVNPATRAGLHVDLLVTTPKQWVNAQPQLCERRMRLCEKRRSSASRGADDGLDGRAQCSITDQLVR